MIHRVAAVAGCMLSVLALGAAASAEAEIRYRVTFDATWSALTHPQNFPAGAHFSPPVGAVHDSDAVFWKVGGLATPGIELMAETGSTGALSSEIQAQAAAGNASSDVILANGILSPGSTQTQFIATPSFTRLTYVTMIAPSPDWFAGVAGLDLFVAGHWRDGLVVPLPVYDAGTDSGPTYTSPNMDTVPQDPISLIVTPPLATDGYAPPIGTFTLEILDVDGLPPYEDPDGDGLTNLQEAELGTDPLLADTDSDTVGDAVDNCPLAANPGQSDAELDGVGDDCDNCPALANASQSDLDADGEGDVCDLNDRLILFTGLAPGSQAWQDETIYTTFNLYRADLAQLVATGEYTQDPSDAAVDRFCGLTSPSFADAFLPSTEQCVFYLVTGTSGTTESGLGADSQQTARPNDHPCP